MGKLTAVAAISAIRNVCADDLQSNIAQRVKFKLSNELKMVEGHRDIGFDSGGRKLRDNSVFTFNAQNSVGNKATGTAPRRQPIVDSDQDHQGVPMKKTAIISSDVNSHLLASHGFHSPYYPNTNTHTCVNDNKYPHSYLYNVGYYFSHSAVECCQVHFSQSIEHCSKAVFYEEHPVGEQSTSSLHTMTSPVVGMVPAGKKKPLLDHYTELEPPPHQQSPYWYQGGKSSKLAKTTSSWEAASWWQGGEVMQPYEETMPSWYQSGKTSKTTSSWEATSWVQGGEVPPPPPQAIKQTAWYHGAKSSKKSKHCKSTESLESSGWWNHGIDTKSGKSKSAKGCEDYLPIMPWLPPPPIMRWPTYSPTGRLPPPKVPTMPPRPFPSYSPTKGQDPPTLRPKQSPTQLPTTDSKPSTPKPSSLIPNVPTTPKPGPSDPTYAPTAPWPTWNPTSSTYAPTGPGTGTMPTTQRPTLAPSSAGPTVPPLDLLVWGSSLSTSQTGDNILTPLDAGITASDASAGSRYSIIISADGTASSTGVIESMENYDGHLGIRPQDLKGGQNLFQPITLVFDEAENGVTSAPRFKKAYAGVEGETGNTHTMFIDSIGRAWATGSNGKGQLCLGDEIDRLIPERIPLPRKIVDIAVGGEFTLLLTDDGVVYGCGSNALGQLGLGPELQVVKQPMNIGLTSPANSISAGKDHSLIMTADGYYVMGSNEFGQLCTDSGGEPLLVPRALAIDFVVTEFKAIKSSTYILFRDGSVNGCGKNDFGQMGDGSNEDAFITTVGVSDVVTLLGVGPSAESAFFVYKDGIVWGTGLNDKGQLGVGDTDNRNVPTLVKTDDITTVLLSAAEDHTLALKEDGSNTSYAPSVSPKTPPPTSAPVEITSGPTMMGEDFFFWGDPKSIGEDGDGINIQQPINLGEGVLDAAAGSHYSMIMLRDSSVVSGGFIKSIEDYKGHLGINPEIVVQGLNALQPVDRVYDGSELISAPLFHRVFAGVENSINTGNIHSIILDREGRAYATGSNNAGQLCLGDEVNRAIPQRIPVDNRIIDVAIGGEHTLLLDEFGNVYGCGSNQLGQLGLGTNIGTSSPVVVSGVDNVAHISAGKDHSLFKAADGIYVTGSNKYGQLCSNTDTIELYVPAKLDLDSGIAENIKQFDAISSSSFILYADGTANGCGKNDFGQLGDGSNEDASITTVVLDGAVRILGVGPSAESAFFVTESKEIFGTGLNDKGQLGIGDQKDRNTPTRVDFDDKVKVSVFAAARDHSIALILGDGTVSPTITPATLEPTSSNPDTSPPTASTTIPVTSSPTKEEGNLPTFNGGIPTYSPTSSTSGSSTTYSPTSTSGVTPLPTYAPTSEEQPNQPPTQLSNALYYWGSGQSIGGEGQITSPEGGDATVADVSAGSRYSVIILPDGTAQSAGYIDSLDDYHGHLGQGNDVTQGQNGFTVITNVLDESEESISPPFFTRAFAGAEQFASPGSMHTILLDSEGGVYATGSNSKGQLCIGDFADRYIPQRIGIVGEIVGVAIGNEHTLLLMNDGTVMGCGSNEFGQLGLGEDVKVENVPTMIDIEGTVDGISSGLAFSLFKSSAGLFVTGNNSYRQLCFDTEGSDIFSPTPLSLGSSISVDLLTSFEAIQSSSFILFKDGGVAACGRNNFGQLGNGSNEDVLRTLVTIPDNTPIRRLGVGPSALSAFFVNTAGNIYATGLNDRGQLGTGDTTDRNTLTEVDISSTGAIVVRADQISASSDHTLSRLSEGTAV